jgi:hypothetical protein
MNKIVYTGPTCYLGQWHFTTCKTYDVHLYERSVYYVMADNDIPYYINMGNSRSTYISLESGILGLFPEINSSFMTLEHWRENQLNKVGI